MPSTASVHAPALASAISAPPPPSRDWALFLDLDGTLCGYRDIPADVALSPPQQAVLGQLWQQLDGAVCVLSGRSAADLQQVFRGLPLRLIGDHGVDAQQAHDDAFLAALQGAETALRELALQQPGTWVERKPASCALHYRQVPDRAACLRQALAPWLPRWPQLRLLDGHDVFEWSAASQSKGTALAAAMGKPPFAGRVPVAVGDDVTDEDAFAAATALGGFGIAVGPRHSPLARHGLADAQAVNRWLAAAVGSVDAQV